MKIYKTFLYIILIGEKTFRYHFRIHGRVPCTVTSVEVHVISVYFILEHVLYFQTTCFPYACLTPIHDHSWTIQSIKIFIACSIICSISFFREHFSGGKFSIFQIFGNFFERWRKYIEYQNECKIEYFRAKNYIFVQLKMAILTYHTEKLVRPSGPETSAYEGIGGWHQTKGHSRTKPSKKFFIWFQHGVTFYRFMPRITANHFEKVTKRVTKR